MASGCFVSDSLSGVPCTANEQCGDELQCLDDFCKPPSCAGDPKCAPFKARCAKGDSQRCGDYGSHGCFYAQEEEEAGYCAYTCETTEQCPSGDGSSAIPACARAEITYQDESREKSKVVGFCVLDCSDDNTCPADMHCTHVNLSEGPSSICLSGSPE